MNESSLKKFQELLRILFQFDCADLDFGFYRILNHKRSQVEAFITERLPQVVDEAFAEYAAADQATVEQELEQKRQDIRTLLGEQAIDEHGQLRMFRDTPLGKEYLALRERQAQYQVAGELKIRVYNDLYTFFARYYEDGDFVSKRRYGRRETYAIPYNGEEVVLHWANRDQYYVKTGERFKAYRFKAGDYSTTFELRNAVAEKNGNKGSKRHFVLTREAPVTWNDDQATLTMSFEYRPLTEAEEQEYGKTEQQRPQNKLNEATEREILELVENSALKVALARPEGANGQSLLRKHLTRFTRRNTADFFVHKDLHGFLRRELDFFIKNEVLLLDELVSGAEQELQRHVQRARVVRNIAERIIDFLAQAEDFQKRLWEKKKFVLRTEYCLTLDRVPQELRDEVLASEAQIAEWRQLYALDDLLKAQGLFNIGLSGEFLEAHPTLVIDTRHFSADFKWRLLTSFDDLDEALDGVLIKSENWQALNLLQEKYREKVKCIYIDPPYNTGSDEFIYKDNYQHSSWLSMMADRLALARESVRDDGVIFISIDDNEQPNLRALLSQVFGAENFIAVVIWQKVFSPKNTAQHFSEDHDYLLVYARDAATWRPRLLPRGEQTDARYSNPDDDPRAAWTSSDLTARNYYSEGQYQVVSPSGKVFRPSIGTYWRVSYEKFQELDRDGRIWWGSNGDSMPRLKRFLSEVKQGIVPQTLWSYKDVGHTQDAKKELLSIVQFDRTEDVLNTVKPIALIQRILQLSTEPESYDLTLDFFAGSGTTGQAVIKQNALDDGNRKFILVEMGDYFDFMVMQRIKRAMHCPDWKDGKPVFNGSGKLTSHFLKYHTLEQYEDTLNNLELPREADGQKMLELFGDEYLLKYMLGFETQGSPCLLNLEMFRDPFAYRLKVQEGDEIQERPVDVVETFNYLLGIDVKRVLAFENDGRLYVAVLGERNSKRTAIVWRSVIGLEDDEEALMKDKAYIEQTVLPMLLGKARWDRLLVNGACFVEGAEAVEPEFKRLIFNGQG